MFTRNSPTLTALHTCVQCGCDRRAAVASHISRFSFSCPLYISARSMRSPATPSARLLARKEQPAKPSHVAAAASASSPKYASHFSSAPASVSASVEVAATPATATSSASSEEKARAAASSTPQTLSSESPAAQRHQQQQQAERPRRRYAPSSTSDDERMELLQRELLQTRLRLAKAEQTNAGLYEGILARLDETDRAALQTASRMRYTGMALRCAHDNLEVELRRLFTIGLTAEDVDAAALEAGARQYVRQNIGFHAQHVAHEPSSVSCVESASKAASTGSKRP